MKVLKENLLFVLLSSYLVLCAFRPPTLADSLIILGLCGLFGFKLYSEYNPKIDIKKTLEENKLQLYQEMSQLKSDLNDKISKISLGIVNKPVTQKDPNAKPIRF